MTKSPMNPDNYTDAELQGLVGKTLLVGLAHCDPQGTAASREQFFGTITRISLNDGIAVKLSATGQERVIPTDLSGMEMARAGQYRLVSTSEVVEDPDYTIELSVAAQ